MFCRSLATFSSTSRLAFSGLRSARAFSGKIIGSEPDRTSDAFKENESNMRALVDELRSRVSTVTKGGGDKAIQRHKDRGKLVVRERIDRVCVALL